MATSWLMPSEADSRRFGLKVVRCRLETPLADPDRARAELRASGADLLVLRVPSGDVCTPRELARAGAELIYADSLVYYATSLPASAPVVGHERFSVRLATAQDAACIERLSTEAFAGYRSHYAANPRLGQRGDVSAGYAEWAVGHLMSADADKPVWVAEEDGSLIAYATVQLSHPLGSAEVVLNAVRPDQQGRGVYTFLLAAILDAVHGMGLNSVRISTQLANLRVQRVWCRLGFCIEAAYDTYHLNIAPPGPGSRTQP